MELYTVNQVSDGPFQCGVFCFVTTKTHILRGDDYVDVRKEDGSVVITLALGFIFSVKETRDQMLNRLRWIEVALSLCQDFTGDVLYLKV